MPSRRSDEPSFTEGFKNFASQIFTRVKTKFNSRVAFREKKVIIRDHQFITIVLTEPTKCSQCDHIVWGLFAQRCFKCKLVSHKSCLQLVNHQCRSKKNIDDEDLHKFKETYFLTPTNCNHCGTILLGVMSKQGLECDPGSGGCGFIVHRECELLICQPCGERGAKSPGTSDPQGLRTNAQASRVSKLSTQDFELIRELGVGTFAKVYLVEFKSSSKKYALKVIKKTTLEVNTDPESVFTEVEVLKIGKHHPFLTTAHCCFQNEARLFIVMEHVKGRSLWCHLIVDRVFTEDRVRFYCAEIVLALRYLHKQGIVYRDLKLEHVIVDPEGHCKLIDFGMAKDLSNSAYLRTRTHCGTFVYISPEMIEEREYGFSVDWWSLGVMTYEMLIGSPPFDPNVEERDEIYHKICHDEVEYPRWTQINKKAKSFIDGLLTKDPQKRLGCNIHEEFEQAILDHPFFSFSTRDWDAIEAKEAQPPVKPEIRDINLQPVYGIRLSPIDHKQIERVPQEDFANFSFYSDSFNAQLEVRQVTSPCLIDV